MKKLQVLGSGCAKCKTLADLTAKAAVDLGLAYEIQKVTDLIEISQFGVMATPALAVDGEVKVVGRVPTLEEIKKMIS
ncbi:MAG: TM0996/MTH895 family glutaredoxin-like protein [Spirochaetes bacterium]|nr:TM0996/MTH895 family glutaredoxin-like protein [Spirochaetota bacterium]